jgi:hypothetical protein
MVRERVAAIAAHWPFVRAHEHRARPTADLVAVDEWIAFTASWSMLNAQRRRKDGLPVCKVLLVGVQSDYWAPADRFKVAIYDRVPGTDHFVKWSGDMQHYGVCTRRQCQALRWQRGFAWSMWRDCCCLGTLSFFAPLASGALDQRL